MLNGRCGLRKLPARAMPKDLTCYESSSPPFPAQIRQTRTLLLNGKAKGAEQSPQLGWTLFKQGTQEGACTKLPFPQSITIPAFCVTSPCVCSALWVLLPWPLHFNASPEGREVEIAKDSSAVGILAFSRDMKPLWLQKRRTMLWLEASRKGRGGKQILDFMLHTLMMKRSVIPMLWGRSK